MQCIMDMAGSTLSLDSMYSRIYYRVKTYISDSTASNQPNSNGSLKRALLLGMIPLPVLANIKVGLTVSDDDGVVLALEQSHGLGLFARRAFEKGHYIISIRGTLHVRGFEYDGEECDNAWCPANGMGCFVICQDQIATSNMCKYINSNQDSGKPPNVGVHWFCDNMVAVLYAIRPIDVGDEFLIKYRVIAR